MSKGLKKKLGKEYFYILSQAYEGITRYNGICIGDDCYNRIGNLDYIWREFTISNLKKYCSSEGIILLDKTHYNEKDMAIFSATYFADCDKLDVIGKSGGWFTKDLRKWNLMLFFNKVNELEIL